MATASRGCEKQSQGQSEPQNRLCWQSPGRKIREQWRKDCLCAVHWTRQESEGSWGRGERKRGRQQWELPHSGAGREQGGEQVGETQLHGAGYTAPGMAVGLVFLDFHLLLWPEVGSFRFKSTWLVERNPNDHQQESLTLKTRKGQMLICCRPTAASMQSRRLRGY